MKSAFEGGREESERGRKAFWSREKGVVGGWVRMSFMVMGWGESEKLRCGVPGGGVST